MFSIGFSELVLIVSDISKSTAFYQDVVGLELERTPNAEWAWFWAGRPNQKQRIALHKGPLLFEEHSPHPAGKRWGSCHFALEIPHSQFEDARRHIASYDVTTHGPIRLEWMQANSFYFYDLDGNLIEFWSPDVA